MIDTLMSNNQLDPCLSPPLASISTGQEPIQKNNQSTRLTYDISNSSDQDDPNILPHASTHTYKTLCPSFLMSNLLSPFEILQQAQNRVTTDHESNTHSSNKNIHHGKGIVYLSWLPPGLSLLHLRQSLINHAPIERIWMQPLTTPPPHLSDSKKKQFIRHTPHEAWVEFTKAKKAYKVSKLLHGQPMSLKRWQGTLWNIKYLKRFAWHDLVTIQLHTNKTKEKRLQQSLASAKREAMGYLQNQAKQERMEEIGQRQSRRGKGLEENEGGTGNGQDDQIGGRGEVHVDSFQENMTRADETTRVGKIETKRNVNQQKSHLASEVLLDDNFLLNVMGYNNANKKVKVTQH